MKILLDNNVPAYAARYMVGHQVSTAAKCGWAALSNGRLLASAESNGFDLLITLDKGFQHQQNLSGRSIGVVIVDPQSQKRSDLLELIATVLPRLDSALAGQVLLVTRAKD